MYRTWSYWLAGVGGKRRAAARRARKTPGPRRLPPRVESLEDRLAPAAATFVNDDWNFVADSDGSGSLTAGDLVNNANDPILGTPSVTARYGIEAFGRVTTGAFTGSLPAANSILEARGDTAIGGVLTLMPGTYNENIDIDKGITFRANGTINGNVTASVAGAVITAGFAGEGRAVINGDLALAADSILRIHVDGAAPGTGFDQLQVNGAVNLGDARLDAINPTNAGRPTNTLIVIDNDGADPVVGTVAGQPEGGTVIGVGRLFRISYVGGDGNDVTLTPTGTPPGGMTGALFPTELIAVGADAGTGTQVKVFEPRDALSVTGPGFDNVVVNLSEAERFDFVAFDGFAGGVRVATGSIKVPIPGGFRGTVSTIAGAGPGAPGGHVKVFDGFTGDEVRSFFAFEGFTGGVFVAAGDVNNDGFDDILVGAGAGATPHVKVFSGSDNAELYSFLAFDAGFAGGVTVGGGDVNDDGFADIIVGAGPGAPGGHVKVFSGQTGAELRSFFAFAGFTGGVFVAGGDLDGDGVDDVAVGAGLGGPAHVKVFRGADNAELHSFLAFDPAATSGVRVAVSVVNLDGAADLVVGTGPGPNARVRVLDGVTLDALDDFFIFGTFLGGVFVA